MKFSELASNKVHIIGINGIGMSALAIYLKKNNINVTGSDIAHNANTEILEKYKIPVFIGHKSSNIKDRDIIFYSSAIKNNLNFKEYDLILSRSGSGSINEILYHTNNVYFMPHLISRDQHQKFNLSYFFSQNMSLKKFWIPDKKNIISQFYFNSLINPYSIEKIICYTTR